MPLSKHSQRKTLSLDEKKPKGPQPITLAHEIISPFLQQIDAGLKTFNDNQHKAFLDAIVSYIRENHEQGLIDLEAMQPKKIQYFLKTILLFMTRLNARDAQAPLDNENIGIIAKLALIELIKNSTAYQETDDPLGVSLVLSVGLFSSAIPQETCPTLLKFILQHAKEYPLSTIKTLNEKQAGHLSVYMLRLELLDHMSRYYVCLLLARLLRQPESHSAVIDKVVFSPVLRELPYYQPYCAALKTPPKNADDSCGNPSRQQSSNKVGKGMRFPHMQSDEKLKEKLSEEQLFDTINTEESWDDFLVPEQLALRPWLPVNLGRLKNPIIRAFCLLCEIQRIVIIRHKLHHYITDPAQDNHFCMIDSEILWERLRSLDHSLSICTNLFMVSLLTSELEEDFLIHALPNNLDKCYVDKYAELRQSLFPNGEMHSVLSNIKVILEIEKAEAALIKQFKEPNKLGDHPFYNKDKKTRQTLSSTEKPIFTLLHEIYTPIILPTPITSNYGSTEGQNINDLFKDYLTESWGTVTCAKLPDIFKDTNLFKRKLRATTQHFEDCQRLEKEMVRLHRIVNSSACANDYIDSIGKKITSCKNRLSKELNNHELFKKDLYATKPAYFVAHLAKSKAVNISIFYSWLGNQGFKQVNQLKNLLSKINATCSEEVLKHHSSEASKMSPYINNVQAETVLYCAKNLEILASTHVNLKSAIQKFGLLQKVYRTYMKNRFLQLKTQSVAWAKTNIKNIENKKKKLHDASRSLEQAAQAAYDFQDEVSLRNQLQIICDRKAALLSSHRDLLCALYSSSSDSPENYHLHKSLKRLRNYLGLPKPLTVSWLDTANIDEMESLLFNTHQRPFCELAQKLDAYQEERNDIARLTQAEINGAEKTAKEIQLRLAHLEILKQIQQQKREQQALEEEKKKLLSNMIEITDTATKNIQSLSDLLCNLDNQGGPLTLDSELTHNLYTSLINDATKDWLFSEDEEKVNNTYNLICYLSASSLNASFLSGPPYLSLSEPPTTDTDAARFFNSFQLALEEHRHHVARLSAKLRDAIEQQANQSSKQILELFNQIVAGKDQPDLLEDYSQKIATLETNVNNLHKFTQVLQNKKILTESVIEVNEAINKLRLVRQYQQLENDRQRCLKNNKAKRPAMQASTAPDQRSEILSKTSESTASTAPSETKPQPCFATQWEQLKALQQQKTELYFKLAEIKDLKHACIQKVSIDRGQKVFLEGLNKSSERHKAAIETIKLETEQQLRELLPPLLQALKQPEDTEQNATIDLLLQLLITHPEEDIDCAITHLQAQTQLVFESSTLGEKPLVLTMPQNEQSDILIEVLRGRSDANQLTVYSDQALEAIQAIESNLGQPPSVVVKSTNEVMQVSYNQTLSQALGIFITIKNQIALVRETHRTKELCSQTYRELNANWQLLNTCLDRLNQDYSFISDLSLHQERLGISPEQLEPIQAAILNIVATGLGYEDKQRSISLSYPYQDPLVALPLSYPAPACGPCSFWQQPCTMPPHQQPLMVVVNQMSLTH